MNREELIRIAMQEQGMTREQAEQYVDNTPAGATSSFPSAYSFGATQNNVYETPLATTPTDLVSNTSSSYSLPNPWINQLPTLTSGNQSTLQTIGELPQSGELQNQIDSNAKDESKFKANYVLNKVGQGIPREVAEAQYEAEKMNGSIKTTEDKKKNSIQGIMPLLYGAGTSADYEAYQLGRFAGLDKGTRGRGLGIASSATALGLGLVRNAMSGYANSNQNQNMFNYFYNQMGQRNYQENPQYQNQNNLSGVSQS